MWYYHYVAKWVVYGKEYNYDDVIQLGFKVINFDDYKKFKEIVFNRIKEGMTSSPESVPTNFVISQIYLLHSE